jgi:hypothetical protein
MLAVQLTQTATVDATNRWQQQPENRRGPQMSAAIPMPAGNASLWRRRNVPVTALDYTIASVLSAFAGILGLFLGPALAVGLLTGGVLPGWLTPDERIRAWLVTCSLLFGPLLAALAFRGHLQAVREGNPSRRPSERS